MDLERLETLEGFLASLVVYSCLQSSYESKNFDLYIFFTLL